jgi:hypothetical protein
VKPKKTKANAIASREFSTRRFMGYVYSAIPAATTDAMQNNQNGAHHGFEDAFIFLPLDLRVMVSAPEFEPSVQA